MQWDRRQARWALLLFLLLFTAGQVKEYLTRPVYPDLEKYGTGWPPEGHLVDATALKDGALEVFSPGTTVAAAVRDLGLHALPLASGFCLPRAGVLYRDPSGWSIRSMTQRERWVWRIPMDLYACEPVDLERIRGIGPILARKISRFVDERGSLNCLSELAEVEGIGPGKLGELMKELEIP